MDISHLDDYLDSADALSGSVVRKLTELGEIEQSFEVSRTNLCDNINNLLSQLSSTAAPNLIEEFKKLTHVVQELNAISEQRVATATEALSCADQKIHHMDFWSDKMGMADECGRISDLRTRSECQANWEGAYLLDTPSFGTRSYFPSRLTSLPKTKPNSSRDKMRQNSLNDPPWDRSTNRASGSSSTKGRLAPPSPALSHDAPLANQRATKPSTQDPRSDGVKDNTSVPRKRERGRPPKAAKLKEAVDFEKQSFNTICSAASKVKRPGPGRPRRVVTSFAPTPSFSEDSASGSQGNMAQNNIVDTTVILTTQTDCSTTGRPAEQEIRLVVQDIHQLRTAPPSPDRVISTLQSQNATAKDPNTCSSSTKETVLHVETHTTAPASPTATPPEFEMDGQDPSPAPIHPLDIVVKNETRKRKLETPAPSSRGRGRGRGTANKRGRGASSRGGALLTAASRVKLSRSESELSEVTSMASEESIEEDSEGGEFAQALSESAQMELYDNAKRSRIPEPSIYCFCKEDIGPEIPMIECSTGQSCPAGHWFHFMCVAVVKAPRGKWWCPGCRDR
ncbi:hypothetical protein DFS34DRAFT_611756 [Phlyctochytrium arcticum]|nr:hypothetical protein DFS34DRAFT_611756 [Phlyctochytrium arcticum]